MPSSDRQGCEEAGCHIRMRHVTPNMLSRMTDRERRNYENSETERLAQYETQDGLDDAYVPTDESEYDSLDTTSDNETSDVDMSDAVESPESDNSIEAEAARLYMQWARSEPPDYDTLARPIRLRDLRDLPMGDLSELNMGLFEHLVRHSSCLLNLFPGPPSSHHRQSLLPTLSERPSRRT